MTWWAESSSEFTLKIDGHWIESEKKLEDKKIFAFLRIVDAKRCIARTASKFNICMLTVLVHACRPRASFEFSLSHHVCSEDSSYTSQLSGKYRKYLNAIQVMGSDVDLLVLP